MMVGFSKELAQDNWIAIILACLAMVPIIFVITRLIKIYPGKNIFDMAELSLGKVGGNIASALFTIYSFVLCVWRAYMYGLFTGLTVFFNTDFSIILFLFFIAGIYLAYSGAENLGKSSTLTAILAVAAIFILIIASLNQSNFRNLLPAFNHSASEIGSATMRGLTIPFGEMVLSLSVADKFVTDKRVSKVYYLSLVVACIFTLVEFLQVCTILGAETMSYIIFPYYSAISIIKFEEFFERIESIVAMTYTLLGIVKFALTLISSSTGVSKIFKLSSYRKALIPIALIAFAFCLSPFKHVSDIAPFLNNYEYAAFFFQFIIPIIIWIFAEIKFRKKSKISNRTTEPEAGSAG